MQIKDLSLSASSLSDSDIMLVSQSDIDKILLYSVLRNQIIADALILRPAALDLSSGAQATDLTIYESGGASEKPNGFRILPKWANGTGPSGNAHTLTTGGTIGGLAASVFNGYGDGQFMLEKTGATTWDFVDPLDTIFDEWETAASGITYKYRKKIKDEMLLDIIDTNASVTNLTSGAYFYDVLAYTIPTALPDLEFIGASLTSITTITWPGMLVPNTDTNFTIYMLGHRATASCYPTTYYRGTWRP